MQDVSLGMHWEQLHFLVNNKLVPKNILEKKGNMQQRKWCKPGSKWKTTSHFILPLLMLCEKSMCEIPQATLNLQCLKFHFKFKMQRKVMAKHLRSSTCVFSKLRKCLQNSAKARHVHLCLSFLVWTGPAVCNRMKKLQWNTLSSGAHLNLNQGNFSPF